MKDWTLNLTRCRWVLSLLSPSLADILRISWRICEKAILKKAKNECTLRSFEIYIAGNMSRDDLRTSSPSHFRLGIASFVARLLLLFSRGSVPE